MTVIPIHTHPLARTASAAESARLVARRLGLADADAETIASTARALVRAGCSAAWAVTQARRAARRLVRIREVQS